MDGAGAGRSEASSRAECEPAEERTDVANVTDHAVRVVNRRRRAAPHGAEMRPERAWVTGRHAALPSAERVGILARVAPEATAEQGWCCRALGKDARTRRVQGHEQQASSERGRRRPFAIGLRSTLGRQRLARGCMDVPSRQQQQAMPAS